MIFLEIHEDPPPLSFEPDDEPAGFDDVDYGDMDEQLPVPPRFHLIFLSITKLFSSFAENEAEVRSIVGDDVASHIFGHANVESDNVSVAGSAGGPSSSVPMDFDDARSKISTKPTVSSASSLHSIDMYTGNNKVIHYFSLSSQ